MPKPRSAGSLPANAHFLAACVAILVGVAGGTAWPGSAVAAEAPTITLRTVSPPSTAGYETDPGLAPDADGRGELFSISGLQGSYGELVEALPGGTLTPIGSAYDAQFLDSAVDADGFDWLLTTEGLMAISAAGAVTNFQIALPAANDMTLGPDGDLYITNTGENAIMQCTITTSPSASCATTIPVPSAFTSVAPQSITSAGGHLWFTTSLGELGSLSTTGTVAGPYDEHPGTFSDGPAGPDANLLATAPDGSLWTTQVASDDATDSQLVHVNASTGAIIARYGTGAGLARDANIIGLTVGPDANVWFIDAGGAGAIGVLDTADGRVTEWPFPRAYGVAPVVPSGIASGPGDSIWFSATTTADDPAVGEISGLAPANVSISRTVPAAKDRSAAVRVGCQGASGAGCAGTLRITVGVSGPRTVTVGTGRYDVPAGHSATATVPLSGAARRLLQAAPGQRLTAAVTATPLVGSPRRFTISLRS